MHLSSFGMRPFVLDATLRLPAVCEELAECATCHMCRGVSSFRRSSIGTKGHSTSCTFCEALHMSPAKPSTTHKSSKLMLPSDMASKHWLPAATSDADDVALLADLQKRLEMGKRGPEKQNSQHYAQALALARGAGAAATIADVPKGGARDRMRQTRNAMVSMFLIEGSNVFGASAPPPLDESGLAALTVSVAAHSTAKVAAAASKRAAIAEAGGSRPQRPRRSVLGGHTSASAPAELSSGLPIAVPTRLISIVPPGIPVAVAQCAEAYAAYAYTYACIYISTCCVHMHMHIYAYICACIHRYRTTSGRCSNFSSC